MKKIILAFCAVCLVLGLSACTVSSNGVTVGGFSTKKTMKGDNNVTDNETALSDLEYELVIEDIEFVTSISDNVTPKITISEDNDNKVTLSTDKNILDTISITLDGSTIKVKGDKSVKYDISEFDLQVDAKVKAFQINGGFEVDMNVPSVTEFSGVVNGAIDGSMVFGMLDSFSLTINGAGDVSIKGGAEKSSIIINGAGSIEAFEFYTANSEVAINGAGTCNVFATDTLDASVSGVGSITYDGDPKTANTSSGIGSITKR